MANFDVIRLRQNGQNGGSGFRLWLRTRRCGPGVFVLAISPVLVMAFATTPRAETLTGYELYRQCTTAVNDADSAAYHLHCTAYLSGYLSALYEAKALSRAVALPIGACPPDHVVVGQYLLIFKRWAERHPEDLSQPAPAALATALVEAFPCRAK